MNKFKCGDKVIIKSTIGTTNEVVEVIDSYMSEEGNWSVAPYQVCTLSNGRDYVCYLIELWDFEKELIGGIKMKIDMNKKYRTRNGKNVEILAVREDFTEYEPVIGTVEGVIEYLSWDVNGNYLRTKKHDYDLIEYVDIRKELKLEVGKSYKDVTGKIVKITGLNRCPIFTFLNTFGYAFKINGESKDNRHYDLIEEVIEEVDMKEIRMNKKYETRDKRDVQIIAICDKLDKPVIGLIEGERHTRCWYIDGTYFNDVDGYKDCGLGLIEFTPYADFKVDDKVLVTNKDAAMWKKGHFMGVVDGKAVIFDDGKTSYTSATQGRFKWDKCIKLEDTTADMVICDD